MKDKLDILALIALIILLYLAMVNKADAEPRMDCKIKEETAICKFEGKTCYYDLILKQWRMCL